jgi:3-hydroxybutyryl-CoA dehydrogenase
MGSGISQVFASAGYPVKVYDISDKVLDIAKRRISESLEKLKQKGLIDENIRSILERISFHSKFEEIEGCGIFMESAFEDLKIKKNIFEKLSKILCKTSFIATNTSSYSITLLSEMVPYPDRFIGFHFMNPPPIMELIEIIRGDYTSDETFNFFLNLAKILGKTSVISKNSPGFVLNRILIPMVNEAIYALYEGISTAEQIDTAMRLGANHPIGPLELADLIGLDTIFAILKTLQNELGGSRYIPCPLLKTYIECGKLGRKTKIGFYSYD